MNPKPIHMSAQAFEALSAKSGVYCIQGDGASERWYVDGELHREDGPAIQWDSGDTEWYFQGRLHREDGPAVCSWTAGNFWYRHGVLHREDGPAIEYPSGARHWYRNGVQVSQQPTPSQKAQPTQGDTDGALPPLP